MGRPGGKKAEVEVPKVEAVRVESAKGVEAKEVAVEGGTPGSRPTSSKDVVPVWQTSYG